MTTDPDDLHKEILDHAWNWFQVHAAQRMQTFNFFFVASAFLVAAYASLLEKYRWAALVVALVGAWLAYWFNRLDNRNRQLIKAGEEVLKASEARIAQKAQLPAAKILENVENPSRGASSYRTVIGVIQWTILLLFLLAAAYTGFLLAHGHSAASGPG